MLRLNKSKGRLKTEERLKERPVNRPIMNCTPKVRQKKSNFWGVFIMKLTYDDKVQIYELSRFTLIYFFNFGTALFIFAAYFDIHFRDCCDKPLGINMHGIMINFFPRSRLYEPAAVHNVDVIAHMLDNAEVVRNEQIA